MSTCLVYLFSIFAFSSAIRVQTSLGTLEGKQLTASYSPLGNVTANVFFGVPYAEPPLGELRFSKPRPPKPWKGVLNATHYKPACMSNITRTYKVENGGPISEDCLYMNIFTNDHCMRKKNCAVMIVIHGGAYLFESASAFQPEILINNFVGQDRNIVVVAINYRLGVFGFGQFHGDDGSTGDRNNALFDVLQATKWVRNEIVNFGGDKDRITVAGHSAGAGMTFHFTTSPQSKGLVHQHIIMSGPLPNMSKKSNFKATTAVAKRLGCLPSSVGFEKLSTRTVNAAYACLRSIPPQDLLDAQLYITQNSTYFFGAPSVDGQFIVDYPDKMLKNKEVFPINTMLGVTSAELRESQYITDEVNHSQKTALLRNLCEHIGYELYEKPEDFSKRCFDFYYGNNSNDSQFLSDDMEFYKGAVDVANAHSSPKTKVFLYNYIYTRAGPAFKKYMPTVPSPHHSEDLIYTFGTHRAVFAPKDYIIEYIYSGMFANFVNFGDPSPSKQQPWKPFGTHARDYFEIDFDEKNNFTMPGMKQHFYPRAIEFWSNEGTKHYKDHWSPSLDTFIITNVCVPIVSHLLNNASGTEKTIKMMEQEYYEREEFLVQLKAERKMELKMKDRSSYKEADSSTINILLVVFAVLLLLGMLYVTVSHCCIHYRSREGYELLRGN